MNKEAFFEELKKVAYDNIKIELSNEHLERMFFLSNKLIETNKIMNLTAICEEKAIILKHLVDSMLLSKYIKPNSSIIDVGSGAGFPSLPLAIIREDINILALDSTEKRVNYIKDTAKDLNLNNVNTVYARAEELSHNVMYREKFDYGCARAVASLPTLCELVIPFIKTDGYMLAMKGSDGKNELLASKSAIETLCGKNSIEKVLFDEYELKNSDDIESRCIIQIRKLTPTNNKYPRMFSKIKKAPL